MNEEMKSYVSNRTILHCAALYDPVLLCNELHCTAAALRCPVLYCVALCCAVLYCPVLRCALLYCTVEGEEDGLGRKRRRRMMDWEGGGGGG